MGPWASWSVSIIVAVGCLATAIALMSVFTDFVCNEIMKGKVDRRIILILVGIIAVVVSMLGFGQICAILGNVLGYIYPFLIAFVTIRVPLYFRKKKSAS
jgi:branched-subunit amino acid permease